MLPAAALPWRCIAQEASPGRRAAVRTLVCLPCDRILPQVRAGTGGEEACLFAMELFRMYERYAQLHGWKFEVSGGMRPDGPAGVRGRERGRHMGVLPGPAQGYAGNCGHTPVKHAG